jgi:arylsulfatase A-like enzyme
VTHPPEAGPEASAPTFRGTETAPGTRGSRWAGLGQSSLTGQRFALGAAFGLWVGDAMVLARTRAGATWSQWAEGMGAAAFVALSSALVLGGLLGPLCVPVVGELAKRAGAEWAAIRRGDVDARHTFLAHVLVLPVLLAAWTGAIYHVAIAILFGFARPETIAAAMAASEIGCTALVLVVWPWAIRGGRMLVERTSRIRGLRRLVAHAWLVPALFALTALAASAAALLVEKDLRQQLASLPWYEGVPVVCLILGLNGANDLPLLPVWARRGVLGLVALVFVAGSVAGLRMRPESSRAQKIGFDRALSGRAGYAAWTFALDFDRDGQINMLGGGDCAPFDPRRYAGAPDLPHNGIDEDCDGIDNPAPSLDARPPLRLETGAVPSHPTVILVTVDALAAPELSTPASGSPIMPRLSELASRSMSFSHCFSQGPSTRLSFPSIFTSRWDSEQKFDYSSRPPYSFSERERTLQEAFDDAGYETAAVIPNAYFDRSRWPSLTKGFQRVDHSALSAPTGKHNAREVTDTALGILSEQRERPLYMWVHYFDAHPPYGPPPGSGATPPHGDDRTYYDAELHYIDRELGRLIDAVDRRSEPTILVFTADHATSFHPVPQSRRYHYGYDIYTSTLHVPLLFHGPALRTGRDDDVVSTMDVAPTLANLLDLNDRGRFEGTSLASELMNGVDDPDRATFHEYYLPENQFHGAEEPLKFVSVRTDRYDLILNREHGTYELYDWTVDYYEQHDLYEERSRSPEATRLRSLLGAFVEKHASAIVVSTTPAASLHPSTTLGEGFPAIEP